mgnify:CR=1 FL=1
MPDKNFLVKNGLTVNTNFVVNSTSLSYSGNSTFNGTNTVFNSNTTYNANLIISTGVGISANGSFGTQGQALLSNGSAVYWATATAGSNTHIQFNDSGAANASAGFTFNKVTNNVSIANNLIVGNLITGNTLTISTSITSNTLTTSTNTVTFGTATYHVSNGFVGIGNSSPVAKLHVQGDVVVSGDVTSAYSDERLKDIIEPIPNALEKVKALTGFYYVPNKTALNLGIEQNQLSKVGVSAQQVREVLPEVVKDAPIGQGYLTVQYEKIVPLLIEAIKELEAKVNGGCSNCSCGGK